MCKVFVCSKFRIICDSPIFELYLLRTTKQWNLWMVTFQNKTFHQFQHWLQLLLHKQMMKDVHFLVQYMRRPRKKDWSKTQSIVISHVIDVMNSHIKLLAYKTLHYVILYYFLKDKVTKEVWSEIDIITTLSTQKIIRKNKRQMRFLYKLLFKQDVDKKLVITIFFVQYWILHPLPIMMRWKMMFLNQ